MITVFKMDRCLELDDILSSISASIEGSLPENTAGWQAQTRFVVRADEELTAFLELESAIHRPDPRKAES
jgi:hypothetical protein